MAITAIHPGEHLAEELRELGMSAAELARQVDVRRSLSHGAQETGGNRAANVPRGTITVGTEGRKRMLSPLSK